MNGSNIDILGLLENKTKARIEVEAMSSLSQSPLRPSAAGKCGRALSYQMAEFKGHARYLSTLMEPATYRLLRLGNDVERHFIEHLKMIAPEFEVRHRQMPVTLGTVTSDVDPKVSQTITGSIDLILWSKDYKLLIDIKSKGGFKASWFSFNKKLKEMKSVTTLSDVSFWVKDLDAFIAEVNDPFLYCNLAQVNAYLCSPTVQALGVTEGSVWQYCKTTSSYRAITFACSKELFKTTMKKFEVALTLGGLQGTPQLVERDFKKGDVACRYCSYEKTCWGETDPVPETKQNERSKGVINGI
jgi:hypothetical protein